MQFNIKRSQHNPISYEKNLEENSIVVVADDKNISGIWEFYLQFTEIWFWILPGDHKLKMLQIQKK